MNMDNNILSKKSNRKRKAKSLRKNKKSKRSKTPKKHVFDQVNFDSSDENDITVCEKLTPAKSSSAIGEFERVVNITPSKSECEISTSFVKSQILESPQVVLSDENTDISTDWSKTKFEELSDAEDSFTYENILEEFTSKNDTSKCEIVAADVGANLQKYEKSYIKLTKKQETEVTETKSEKKALTFENVTISSNKNLLNSLFDHEAQCHYTNDGIMVILDSQEIIYLHGLCLLSVLHGEVEVLGHILNKNSPEAEIYSPRGSSLLYLKNVTKSDIPIKDYLLNLKKSNKIKVSEKSAIVFCKKLIDPQINFIEKHISQQILPKEQQFPRVVFQPKEGSWNLLKVSQDWDNIINGIKKKTKLMICGGKGVGKTTFMRFAINRLLMRYQEIRIIDLDPGQSEFTIPGSISIIIIKKPIFGVNYTHIQKTERSILSNISISYEPDKYISSVRQLINTQLNEIPTLINYMGYTHGVGLNILSAVISCIQPTDILQIYSTNAKKNYKVILRNDTVRKNASLFIRQVPILNYNLHQIETMTDQCNGWTAEPRALREMSILAYISKMIVSESIFKSTAPMYKINLNDIIISDLNGNIVHPAVINACIVALCRLENEMEQIFECLSWGIVRGIDLLTNELVLITSEENEILDKVSHLVSNNGVTLPPSIYMTPDDVTGAMPYVIEGTLMSFGQIPKRSRVSAKKTV